MPAAKRKPTADEKPATKVEDTKEPADDEQTPDPVQDNETSGEAPEGAADSADGDGDESDTGTVDMPCRRCFPDGWPVAEEGAFVNCAHDFGLRFGDQVEITRERAAELGFLDED